MPTAYITIWRMCDPHEPDGDQNVPMTDVSIYVALIAGAAGVAGASIPAVTVLIRDMSDAKRARSDQREDRWQHSCLDLLRSAQELRTKVANAAQYHGTEMSARLEEIRGCEADVQVHAASAALYAGESLAALADDVAEAASRLAAQAIQNTNMHVGEIDPKPDLAAITKSISVFRKAVVSEPRA